MTRWMRLTGKANSLVFTWLLMTTAIPDLAEAGPWSATEVGFYDDFSAASLSSDWLVAKRNWGGQVNGGTESYNGGVHPDLVSVSNGVLRLEAHGNQWASGPTGINTNGCERSDGRRVGAAIATDAYHASGRYEIRAKVAPELGVCSAMWTFHYQELYPGDAGYIAGDYTVVNHEIDMELPGRPAPANEDISFTRGLMNTWIGAGADEYSVSPARFPAQDDGQWHTYRFDWHTGSTTQAKRVEFYVDDQLVAVNLQHVPTLASRFWLGAWFPHGWAGEPDFASAAMQVDWVRITPFHEAGDEQAPETYAMDGWATSAPACTPTAPPPPPPGPPVQQPEPVQVTAKALTFDAAIDISAWNGVLGMANDAQDGCGVTYPPGSEGVSNWISGGGDGNSGHLQWTYLVRPNNACGYQYSAMYVTLGGVHQDLTGYTTLSFYARGQTALKVMLQSTSSDPCLSSQYGINRRNQMSTTVSLSGSWKRYTLQLEDFTNYQPLCPYMNGSLASTFSVVFSAEQGWTGGSLDLDTLVLS